MLNKLFPTPSDVFFIKRNGKFVKLNSVYKMLCQDGDCVITAEQTIPE